jgi:putative phosphotransacetylase
METEKGRQSLRVVGPARRETQIELSVTDCYRLGVKPVLRMSGDTSGTPGCTLVNGDRRVAVDRGVIVAARHLHMSPAEATSFGLKDGDVVEMRVEGPRATTIGNLVVRSGPAHSLEAHIDKDEANACGVADGALCRLVLPAGRAKVASSFAASPPAEVPAPAGPAAAEPALRTYVPKAAAGAAPAAAETALMDISGERRRLLSEDDVLLAVRNGHTVIRHAPDAIITPLARDAASTHGVTLTETN